MPTPGGKLKSGDIIVDPTGAKHEVQMRIGNDINYAVRIWKLGDPAKKTTLLTEAGWWITKGDWYIHRSHGTGPIQEKCTWPCPVCESNDTTSLTVKDSFAQVIWCCNGHVTVNTKDMPEPIEVWNFCPSK